MKLGSIVIATLAFACHKDHGPPAAPPPAAVEKPPTRGAVGDTDLREMLAEVASSKACTMIEGHFLPLHAADRPEIVTGVLWIRGCQITNDGLKVAFELTGNGWQWADQTKHEAAATFVVREYVKFSVHAMIRGALDIAYDRGDHVVSIWFSPAATPDITFTPVGKVEVDKEGTWSSVVGALASAFAESPNKQGAKQAKEMGKQQFESQLAGGLTVAIDLCTGTQRFKIGRVEKGSLGPPEAGESRGVPIELQPGGLMVFGPELAPHGMTVKIDASGGAVEVGLACQDQAEAAAQAFVDGKPPQLVATLAQLAVHDHGALAIKAASCAVMVIARSLSTTPITFDWQRPATEKARTTGGPVIHCGPKSRG